MDRGQEGTTKRRLYSAATSLTLLSSVQSKQGMSGVQLECIVKVSNEELGE